MSFFVLLSMLAVTANAALTTNNIMFANGSTVYVLNKTTNMTISANAGSIISSVRVSQDGNKYIVVTTASQIRTYDGSLTLLHAATPSLSKLWNVTGCTRYNDNYYCGWSNNVVNQSGGVKYDLSGSEIANYSYFGAANSASGTITVGSNNVIYASNQRDAGGGSITNISAYDLTTGTLLGNFTTTSVLYPDFSYNAATNQFEIIDYAGTLRMYNLNANGSIASLNTTYTATYAIFPRKTTTGSYITMNATGFYEYDGLNYYNYTFAFSGQYPFKFGEYTTSSVSQGNLQVRSSNSFLKCGAVEAVSASCVFTSGTNSYNVYLVNNASETTANNISAQPRSNINGLIPTNTFERNRYGFLKPENLCWWNENDEYVGGSGLNSLTISKTYDMYGSRAGFEVSMIADNYKWDDGLGNWHWHTGHKETLLSRAYPGIMAGKYAAPVIIDFLPVSEIVDYSDLKFQYDIFAGKPENWMYLSEYTADNMLHMALAVNSSHYAVYNISSNSTMENIKLVQSANVTWAELRVILEAYDTDLGTSIDELLPLTPMDTQTYAEDPETGLVKVYGYVWAEINRTYTDFVTVNPTIWATNEWVYPVCANNDHENYSMFIYDERDSFLKYSDELRTYSIYTLSTVPLSTSITHTLSLFNVNVFPTLEAPVSNNLYFWGTQSVPIGNYSYSCESSTGNIKTGTYTVYDAAYNILVLQFNATADQNIGIKVNVRTRDNQIAPSGTTCSFQSGSYELTTAVINGSCYAYSVPQNSYVNITVANGHFITKYTKHVNDAYNSDREGEGGSCATFKGLYEYTLFLNPELFTRTMKVTCENYLVPNAEVIINNDNMGRTDANGELLLQLTQLTTPLTQGWVVAVNSDYGNDSTKFASFEPDPLQFKMLNCNSSALSRSGAGTNSDISGVLGLIASPFMIALVILLSLAMSAVLISGSPVIGIMALVMGTILFTIMGFFPMIVLVVLLLIAGLGTAAVFMTMGRG